MNLLKYVGIIPARYASTRFPGKPLALIGSKPMIQRVYEQASKVLKHVYVATDDIRIAEVVKAFGGEVIMTASTHLSGTDRCYEAYCKMEQQFDVVINIQGDEPFIDPTQIEALMRTFLDPETEITTVARKVTVEDGLSYIENQNQVKLVVNKKDEAMYFSRSIIPFIRGKEKEDWPAQHHYLKHLGIYAYQTKILGELTELRASVLEKAESLEQLRWLENGYKIKVCYTDTETIGIDTPEDLERVNLKYAK